MVAKIEYGIKTVDGGFVVTKTQLDENHGFIGSEDFEAVHATEELAVEEMEEVGQIQYETLIEAGSGSTETEIVYNRLA